MQRGGVVVRTDAGDVDATLDSQLERLLRGHARRAAMPDAERLRRRSRSTRSGCGAPTRTGSTAASPRSSASSSSPLGPEAEVGEICLIGDPRRARLRAEVVGFRDGPHAADAARRACTASAPATRSSPPAAACDGARRHEPARPRASTASACPIDGGEPLEGGGRHVDAASVVAAPPSPLQRAPITERMAFGVRALDTIIPCGKGQRLGIFAGSGVGKSTLLGMIARNTEAEVNVIALVGERGREVREFIERDLGPEGMARSVVVVATSDQPALLRAKCARDRP